MSKHVQQYQLVGNAKTDEELPCLDYNYANIFHICEYVMWGHPTIKFSLHWNICEYVEWDLVLW
jgi:hypothetical protein